MVYCLGNISLCQAAWSGVHAMEMQKCHSASMVTAEAAVNYRYHF
jgi:hypothetical protein